MIKIPLKGPLGIFYNSVVDNDCEYLLNHNWIATKSSSNIYAVMLNDDSEDKMPMHRMIMGNPDEFVIDHINGNTLDNRRLNLRICSNTENAANKSGSRKKDSRGIKWKNKGPNRYYTGHVRSNKKLLYAGSYQSKDTAIFARDLLCVQLHGEFSCPNLNAGFNYMLNIDEESLSKEIDRIFNDLSKQRINDRSDLYLEKLKSSLPKYLNTLRKIRMLEEELERE